MFLSSLPLSSSLSKKSIKTYFLKHKNKVASLIKKENGDPLVGLFEDQIRCLLVSCTRKNVWYAPGTACEHWTHQIKFQMSNGRIEVERLAREGPAPAWLSLWHDVGSFTCLSPLWPPPPPAHQPAFSLACVLPLSSISLVIGKFQQKVIEPVTVHPVCWLRGTKGRRVRMYRPTLDSRVRNQQPLSTPVHKHIHLPQSWAGVCVVRVKILTNA